MLKLATKFMPHAHAFETAIAGRFGFAEIWLDSYWLSRWETIVRLASKHQLEYALHFPNHGDLNDTTLSEAIQLYRELNCSAMVIHEPMLWRCGERLLEQDATLRLGVENHRLDLMEFERWAVQNTWLTLDVEHLWKYTLQNSPVDVLLRTVNDFLVRFRDKLIHVHLPGYVPEHDEHRPMYCSREMVFRVFSSLVDHQFNGLIVSEVNPEFQNICELQMDVLLFDRWRELRKSEELVHDSVSPHVA